MRCSSHRQCDIVVTVLWVCFLVTLVCGCRISDLFSSQAATSDCPSFPVSASRPAQIIALGLDINAAYNRNYANQTKNAIAMTLDNAVQPGQGAKTLYVSLITDDSYNPAATVLVITLPAIASLPHAPIWSADPYTEAKQKACFQTSLSEAHRRLQHLRQDVQSQTDKLRSYVLPPPVQGEDDIDGFLVRASLWFQGAPGTHIVLMASGFRDKQDNEYDGDIPGVHLPSAVVRTIWYDCGGKETCTQYTPAWRSVFSHAGATTIEFLDPAVSSTLTSFF